MRKYIMAIVVLICVTGTMAWASTAGKIVGTVTDAGTGQPLAGVNVFLEGTTMGAATDENGFYVILNVPPGDYTIRSSMIGYAPVTVQDIQVSMGLTTTIDFQMTTEALRTGEVIVVAERPLLKKDEFTSRHSVSSEDITMQPIENFRDIARNQAGVVGNNFREAEAVKCWSWLTESPYGILPVNTPVILVVLRRISLNRVFRNWK